MKLRPIIKKFGLLGTFSILSLISIISISIISGSIFFNFIQNNLLRRELVISSEFIQSVSLVNDPELYFDGGSTANEIKNAEEFFQHISNIPDVFRVTIYNNKHKIIWSDNKQLIGKAFTDNDELADAYKGEYVYKKVVASDNAKREHSFLPTDIDQFLEGYIPVWDRSHQKIIGAIELYKSPRALFEAINKGRLLVIAVSILAGFILFGLLYWIVRTAHQLIETQKRRIKLASSRSVELNERNLRRIGSELHDGPAQSIGFALLKLDSIFDVNEVTVKSKENVLVVHKIQTALKDALQEIRSLSAGLVIPDLNDLCADSAIQKVINRHEKRTSSKVKRRIVTLPDLSNLSTKICIYRFIQEGLNNAFRHGEGVNQSVSIEVNNVHLHITVRDEGPGMKNTDINRNSEHLGLQGLRERVESLGGTFQIMNNSKTTGVTLIALLPIK